MRGRGVLRFSGMDRGLDGKVWTREFGWEGMDRGLDGKI